MRKETLLRNTKRMNLTENCLFFPVSVDLRVSRISAAPQLSALQKLKVPLDGANTADS